MARTYSCDFCGQSIEDELLMVTLSAHGHAYNPDGLWGNGDSRRDWVGADVGYYHATEDQPCWAEMLDRLGLIHDVSSGLGPRPEELAHHREQRERRQRARDEGDREAAAYRAARDLWRSLGWEARESLLLELLGGERLTMRELAVRISDRLGAAPDPRWPAISPTDVRSVAMRLLNSGRVEREGTGSHRGHTGIWEWQRKRGLEGEILDLERRFNDEAEAA